MPYVDDMFTMLPFFCATLREFVLMLSKVPSTFVSTCRVAVRSLLRYKGGARLPYQQCLLRHPDGQIVPRSVDQVPHVSSRRTSRG